jgi:hypothetical protein
MRSLTGILSGPLRPGSSRLGIAEGAQPGPVRGAPLRSSSHSTGRSAWLASRQRSGLGPPLTPAGHERPESDPAAGGSGRDRPSRPRAARSGFAAGPFSGPGSTGGYPPGQGPLGGWAGRAAEGALSGFTSDQPGQPAPAGRPGQLLQSSQTGQLGPPGYFDRSGQFGRSDRTEPQKQGGRGASAGDPGRARSAGSSVRPTAKVARSGGEPGPGSAWPGESDPAQDRRTSGRPYDHGPLAGGPTDGSSAPLGRTRAATGSSLVTLGARGRPEAQPGTGNSDISARPLSPTARTGTGRPAHDWSAAASGTATNAADAGILRDRSGGAGPGYAHRGGGGMPSSASAIPATGGGAQSTSAPERSSGSPAGQPGDGDHTQPAPHHAVTIRPAPDDPMPQGYLGWGGRGASPAAERPGSRSRGVSIEIGRIEIRTMAPPRPSAAPAPRTPARRHVIDPGLRFIGRW